MTGSGHIDFGYGIPERVEKMCKESNVPLNSVSVTAREKSLFNKEEKPADYVLLFVEESEE